MANRYTLAIGQPKEIREKYNDLSQVSELKNHAKVVVRNFGDDTLIAHFQSMTNFALHTHEEVRLKKIKKAIDVMIRAFELKSIDPTSTLAGSVTPNKWEKRVLFSLLYIVVGLSVIIYSNKANISVDRFKLGY